jgi:heat shock protein 1/8
MENMRKDYMNTLMDQYRGLYNVTPDCMDGYEQICSNLITKAMQEVVEKWKRVEPIDSIVELEVRNTMRNYKKEMDVSVTDDSPYLPPEQLNRHHHRVQDNILQNLGTRVKLTHKVMEEVKSAVALSFMPYKNSNDMKAAEGMDAAIGIDLGTTYSCVGVFRKGKVEMIPEMNGHKITIPSYVFFQPSKTSGGDEAGANLTVVGDTAKDCSPIYPHLSIFDSKRLIGRRFEDKEVQEDMKLWPFKVLEDGSTKRIKIEVDGKTYYPEEISAKILEKLKENAEVRLGYPVKKAVVTVPAYFTDGQKIATRNAAEIAGLDVLELLSEPTSAAIAYNLHFNTEDDGNKRRNIFVYDMGGGTFDVSVLASEKGKLDEKAVGGNNHLGGQDFDNLMVRYCIDEFERQNKVTIDMDGELTQEKSEMRRRIRHKCEEQKKYLSERSEVRVKLVRLHGNLDMDVEITREQFNRMIDSLIDQTIEIARKALEESKLTITDIGDVILGKIINSAILIILSSKDKR